MTATRERRRDVGTPAGSKPGGVPWDERPLFGISRGVPWWGAVLLALALTGLGVFVDIEMSGRLGILFKGCYFLGCVFAVCWIRRKSLFGPMVQPPLILALMVPGVVLVSSGAPAGAGLSARLLVVANPLVNGFPTMAVTTVLTVLVGLLRLVIQRDPLRTEPRRQKREADLDKGDDSDEEPEPIERAPRPAARAPKPATNVPPRTSAAARETGRGPRASGIPPRGGAIPPRRPARGEGGQVPGGDPMRGARPAREGGPVQGGGNPGQGGGLPRGGRAVPPGGGASPRRGGPGRPIQQPPRQPRRRED